MAFDTIDHGSLLNCLQQIGIQGHVLNSFFSYLKDETFLVETDNYSSSCALVLYGVTHLLFCNPKVVSLSLKSGRNCRWGGSEWTALSSTFNTTTAVPLSKAPNPQLLAGCVSVCVHGVCVCVHCCVCALGWPHVTSLSLFS